MTRINLDSICAQYAFGMVRSIKNLHTSSKKLERSKIVNAITKSIGVLQENGVYALFLYLDAMKNRSEFKIDESESIANVISKHLKNLLANELKILGNSRDFEALRELTKNLNELLLARQTLEQVLIYARYHAKALPSK